MYLRGLLHKGRTRSKCFLGCDIVHASRLDLEVNLGYTQFSVQGCDRLLHQFIGVKINHINRLGIDAIPESLELWHSQFLIINLKFNIIATGIFGLHSLTVIDGINDTKNGLDRARDFIGEFDFTVCLVLIILIGKSALLVDVALHTQTNIDFSGNILGDNIGIAFGIGDSLAHEQFGSDCFRTVRNSVSQFSL